MTGYKYLKVTLTIMALYAGLMGAFTLFFQDVAEFMFKYTIRDPLTTRYWGGMLMAMAILYLFLSTDPEKYRLLLWVGVFDLGLASTITIISISTASINIWQGFTAIILNPIFMVVLLYGLAKKPEGEVVLVAGEAKQGKPEHELPAHLSGQHPLHGK